MSTREERTCVSGAPTGEGMANAISPREGSTAASRLFQGETNASTTSSCHPLTDSSNEMDTTAATGKLSPSDGDNKPPEPNPFSTPMHPEVDLRLRSPPELYEMLIKYRANFTSYECQRHKLLRKGPDAEGIQLIAEIDKMMMLTWRSMEMVAEVSQLPLFSSPPPSVNRTPSQPPSQAEPTSTSVSTDSAAPSAEAENVENVRLNKRPLEAEPHNETGWSTQGKSKKKNNKINSKIPRKESVQNTTSQANVPETQNESNKAKKPKIPPFYILPPDHWHTLNTTLRMIAPSRKSKMKGKYLKVQVDNEDHFRAVQSWLLTQNIEFKSYLLDEQRPIKLVLRGLPINTPCELIKNELSLEGFEGMAVTQMFRGPVSNKKFIPLFHVNLPKQIEVDRIFSITELMGTEVSFENYRGKKGPSQCFNCQGYFHSAAACNLAPHCVKCAGDHRSSDCRKSFDAPCKCYNCGGDHSANYRNCPKFPKTGKNPKNSKFNKIGAPALKNLAKKPTIGTPFQARKTEDTLLFSSVATGKLEANPLKAPKLQSAPASEAIPGPDFLKYVISLEERYPAHRVLAAFKKALPALCTASTEIHRQFILYESLVTLVL